MQSTYVDKYEEELKQAMEKATIIPSHIRWKIPHMSFLGASDGKRGKSYYYKDGTEYYYESEFDREMRMIIRNKRFQKCAKR